MLRSAHPPERLVVELQSRIGPSLSHKGYRLVASGPAGLTWRREITSTFIAGSLALALFAVGGVSSGEPASIALGLACAIAGVAWFLMRHPSCVVVGLSRASEGTHVAISGGRDAASATELAKAVLTGEPSRPAPPTLAEPMARFVRDARAREASILEVVRLSEPVDAGLVHEVRGFIETIHHAAERAQLLHAALAESPPDYVRGRIAQLRDEPSTDDIVDALERQLAALLRMQGQLASVCSEIERMLVELDTIRSHLVSVAAGAERSAQREAARDLRNLREQLGAVADAVCMALPR